MQNKNPKGPPEIPPLGRTAMAITVAVATTIVTAIITAMIMSMDVHQSWKSLGSWLSDFAKSSGLAGLCAVIAASLALHGIRQQVATTLYGIGQQVTAAQDQLAHQRDTEDQRSNAEEQRAWWERFEWVAGRAVPTSGNENPLPYTAIASALTALLDTAKDDVQKNAVEAIMETAKPTTHYDDKEFASERLAATNNHIIRVLKNYVQTAGEASVNSNRAKTVLYELLVAKAFRDCLPPEGNEILQDPSLPTKPRPGMSVIAPDMVIQYKGKKIIIEIKNYANQNSLTPDVVAAIYTMIKKEGADGALIVSPITLVVPAIEQGGKPIDSVKWNLPDDNKKLLEGLNILTENK